MTTTLQIEKRVAVALFLLLGTAIGIVFARESHQPDTYLLTRAGDAQWMRHGHPLSLLSWGEESRTVFFRSPALAAGDGPVQLALCGLRRVAVFWNGELIGDSGADLTAWRKGIAVTLPADEAGRVEVAAMNHNGPVLLRVASTVSALSTPGAWESSLDQTVWTPAVHAGYREALPVAQAYPRPWEALLGRLPWLIVAGIFAAGLVYWRGNGVSPSGLRWGLLIFWAALGLNNLLKIPANVGMDALPHLEYIAYVALHWRIPLATDGWQMFQSPLYYLISAPLYSVLAAFLETDRVMQGLRVVPLICGALQTEVAFRTARLVLPESRTGQSLATLFGALIPMQIYIAQVVGNEALCSLLGSVVLYQILRLLTGEASGALSFRRAAGIGMCFGLALLTKASALLLGPLIAAGLGWRIGFGPSPAPRSVWPRIGVLFAVAGLLAAPYYLRNWIHLGKPFSGGWDPARAIVWWQDPGYRTPADFLHFGNALTAPIYSAVHGLWDSLYSTLWLDGSLSGMAAYAVRPPWNDGWLVAGAILGLIPSAVLLLGLPGGLMTGDIRRFRMWGLSVVSVTIYVAALAHHFLTVPFYSSGKATYLGAIAPALVILFACGIAVLQRHRLSEAAAAGFMAAWALSVACTYWVI